MQKSTSIDTYALEFFLSLMETRSLAASADDFAVSSATAQRMLQKLRAHFADPLFTREGFAMRPTAKAERIAVKLRPLLAGLRRLGRDAEEDYSTRRETLRFAAYDNACASIFASLFPRLMARAPNLTLQFLQADERMFELLRAGDLDFVIYARQGLSPDLRSAALLTTPYVWVARKSHPLEAKARKNGFISPADAESFPQVIANAQPDRRRTPNGPAEGWFQPKHGRAPVLQLPFFLAAPYFLEGSDALCVLPRALAELALDPGRFSLLPAPANAPTLTMRLAWHKRTDEDPYFQWVRGLFEVLLREREAQHPAFARALSKSLTQKGGLSREETGTAGAGTD